MQGKIIKGVAGQYLVMVEKEGLFDCKAKGIFRKDNEKPMVGDVVEIEKLPAEGNKKIEVGNIVKILPRKNSLIRPAVSNIDQALVIFSVTNPKPNFILLDRFLIYMASMNVDCNIIFSKEDLDEDEELQNIMKQYEKSGARVFSCSVKNESGIEEIKKLLKGKTSTVAGPSGVGKSSLINILQSDVVMEVGEISEKIDRGKHTTRHSQLIALDDNTYILDTPGFSSLELFDITEENLASFYPEFGEYESGCRFIGCTHLHEPVCGVKEALAAGEIAELRYSNYCTIYQQLKDLRETAGRGRKFVKK